MSTTTAVLGSLLDTIAWRWRALLCQAIDRVRPGAGHQWLERCEPEVCRWCGTVRR